MTRPKKLGLSASERRSRLRSGNYRKCNALFGGCGGRGVIGTLPHARCGGTGVLKVTKKRGKR